jgi:4-nitrophenyl phosphatase
MSRSHVAALILAAGCSSRFGHPKQLLNWDGRPLLLSVIDTAWVAGLHPIIVVLGAFADEIEPVLASRPVQIQRNYRWSEGICSSIRSGVSALSGEVDAAIFIPADQPFLTADFLQNLVCRYEATGKSIVIPRIAEGQRGSPVLFDRSFFAELSQLSGDVGGRRLFDKYSDDTAYLSVSDSSMLMDIDTPEAYTRLQELAAGRSVLDLTNINGIVCDMDGVLWRGQESLAGFHDFFDFIHSHEFRYVLVTNNSSRTPEQYAHKLARLGVEVGAESILNSAVSAAHYVASVSPGATVFPIGGPGVMAALQQYGLRICNEDANEVDFVVVGWDQKLTWLKLAVATRLILNGAQFIGTNPDLTFPMEASLAPGNGAQLAALHAATGVQPLVTGKPEALLYQQAMDRMKTVPETTLVIGDRLDTDILGGVRLGMPTAMILTGVSGQDILQDSPIRPSTVFDNLPQLVADWNAQLSGSEK